MGAIIKAGLKVIGKGAVGGGAIYGIERLFFR